MGFSLYTNENKEHSKICQKNYCAISNEWENKVCTQELIEYKRNHPNFGYLF